MPHRIEDWLNSDPSTVDYYQLADLPRFHADRAALLKAIFSAEQVLAAILDTPAEAPRHERARRWQNEIQQATRTFADDRAWQAYDDSVLVRMRGQYSIEAAGDPDAWRASHVRHWLERSQGVATARLDAVQAAFTRDESGPVVAGLNDDRARIAPFGPLGAPRVMPIQPVAKPAADRLPARAALPPRLPGMRPPHQQQAARVGDLPMRDGEPRLPAANAQAMSPGGGRAPAVPAAPASRNGTLWLLGSAGLAAVIVVASGAAILLTQVRNDNRAVAQRATAARAAENDTDDPGTGSSDDAASTAATGSPGAQSPPVQSDATGAPDPHSAPAKRRRADSSPAAKPPRPVDDALPPSTPADPYAANDQNIRAQPNSRPIRAIAWGRDGTSLAFGGEEAVVRIWNTADNAKLRELDAHCASVTALAWSSLDESYLASACSDGKIVVWDTDQGSLVMSPATHGGLVTSLAWGGDSTRLLSGDDAGKLGVWDMQAQKLSETVDFASPAGAIRALCSFRGPASQWLAVSGHQDGSIVFWDVADSSLKSRRMILPHDGALWKRTVAAGRAADLAEPGVDEREASRPGRRARQKKSVVRKARPATIGQKAHGLNATPYKGQETCFDLAVKPDGQLLAVATRDVEIWDLRQAAVTIRIRTLPALDADHDYRQVAWNRNGTLLAAADEKGGVQIWETQNWNVVLVRKFETVVNALGWQPDAAARLAAALGDGSIRILSVVPHDSEALAPPPFAIARILEDTRQLAKEAEWEEVSLNIALLRSYRIPASDQRALEKLATDLEREAQSRLEDLQKRLAGDRPRKSRGLEPSPPEGEETEDDYVDIFLKHQQIIDLSPEGTAGRDARRMLESLADRQ